MGKIKVGSTVKSSKGQVGKVFEVDRKSQPANANGQPDVVIMCDGELVWLLGTEYTLEDTTK